MFSSNGKKPAQDNGRLPNEISLSIISPGTVISGDVVSEGDIRIEGRIIGTLVCKSRLVIGPQGMIDGNVDAANATISGQITGSVVVRELLQLQETGKIYGDITTEKFVMQAGGTFTGTCKMGPEAVEILRAAPIVDAKLQDNRKPQRMNESKTLRPEAPMEPNPTANREPLPTAATPHAEAL